VLKFRLVVESERAPSGGGRCGPALAQPVRNQQRLNKSATVYRLRIKIEFECGGNTLAKNPLRF
jgi:hypothetical protein